MPVPNRIIPAYAGSTLSHKVVQEMREDHPRIRGEHWPPPPPVPGPPGSSPHTRGAPRQHKKPAHSRRDHPRIRGEHFQTFMADIAERGSSPHTRGAHRPVGRSCSDARIIPAYAGSTADPAKKRPAHSDHPRIRGEHPGCQAVRVEEGGSSPHTRGARRLGGRL